MGSLSDKMMQKPDDPTYEECQEAFTKMSQVKFNLIMDNANLWHLRDQIFEDLSHKDVLNCRRVCKYWNESLRRMFNVKFIQEFGDRDIEQWEWEKEKPDPKNKVSTIILQWKNTAQKYGVQASMEDLEEVKDSLKNLARGKGKCCKYPVHEAAKKGDVKLVEFILRTSYDMNTKDRYGHTAWHWACKNGRTETAQLIIQNSKECGIDLNAKDKRDKTAWHLACIYGKTETAQLIIQNAKELGIDLNAKDNNGCTPWHTACYYGQTETAQLLLKSSKEFGIDLNAKDINGRTAWHLACIKGQTETVQLIIRNSKECGIDLNAKDYYGETALHGACWIGLTKIVQMILKNWKEFGIDIKVQNNNGEIALDLIKRKEGERYDQIKKLLENEYSQIEIESVQNQNVE